MKKWNVLIVEDEPIAQQILENYILKMPQLQLSAISNNCKEALKELATGTIDLILMDINMPGINGIDFIRLLEPKTAVIFTTAYTDYAFESYELEAIDYLLKPISFERFQKAIARLEGVVKPTHESTMPIHPGFMTDNQIMFIKSSGKLLKVDMKELWLIESLRDYIKLYVGSQTIVAYSSMKNISQKLLPFPHFLRVNKSSIVNFKFIKEIDGNTIKVKDASVIIGPTFRERVQLHLKHYTLQ